MISSTLRTASRFLTKDVVFANTKYAISPSVTSVNIREIHITSKDMKEFRVGNVKVRAGLLKDNATYDAETTDIDSIQNLPQKVSLFPDDKTPHLVFDGVPYNDLHIINIKSTPNNTIMSLTDCKGQGILLHSAGCEGFKNTRKGTNVAAQQTAITFANKSRARGIVTVRLRIQGVGPGRSGAIKGLQLAGLNVVSITDDTRVSWNPPRPRKQRRV